MKSLAFLCLLLLLVLNAATARSPPPPLHSLQKDPCATPFCRETTFSNWTDLSPALQQRFSRRWKQQDWDTLGPELRWYYLSEWHDLSQEFQTGLQQLGWSAEQWAHKYHNITRVGKGCILNRLLVELRPWSRLTTQEQEISSKMGFNEYNWFTKEMTMSAWQGIDGNDIAAKDLPRTPATMLDNGEFEPIKLRLDIPELAAISWDHLEQSTELIHMKDPYHIAPLGNDEQLALIPITMQDFIRGLKAGEPFYIKLEDEEQDMIAKVMSASGVRPIDLLAKHLEGTKVGDRARLGPKYQEEETYSYAQLYIGGTSSVTNMHLDVQAFNFLYVAAGKKRIRLLPHDARTAANFTWGLEAYYSVWTGFDLLHTEPIPEHGVEIILHAGEGVMVPYMTWHAVENLEPTIAFGLIRDFPFTETRRLWCAEEQWDLDSDDDKKRRQAQKRRMEQQQQQQHAGYQQQGDYYRYYQQQQQALMPQHPGDYRYQQQQYYQ